MVNQDRNIFGSLLLALGEADADDHRRHRTYSQTMRQILRVLDPIAGRKPFGIHVLVGQSHTVFMADHDVTERPTSESWPTSPSRPPPSPDRWGMSRASPSSLTPPSAIRRAIGWSRFAAR